MRTTMHRSKLLITTLFFLLIFSTMAWAYEPLVLDDGTADIGVGMPLDNCLWLNRFTPEDGGYLLAGIQFMFRTGELNDDAIDVFVWQDDNENPADGAVLLAVKLDVPVLTLDDWNTVELDTPVRIEDGMDILIGVLGYNSYLPIDETSTQQRSYAAAPDEEFRSTPTLPPATSGMPLDLIDNFGFPGNWMIRGIPLQIAHSPSPADGAVEIPLDTFLSWETGDDVLTCDLYFGESGDMASVATGLESPDLTWTPESLDSHVTYQWQVICHTASEVISADTWTFRTTYESEIDEAGLDGFVLTSADLSEVLSPDVFVVVSEDRVGEVDLSPMAEALAGVSFDVECLESVTDDELTALPLTVTFRLTSTDLGQDLFNAIEEEASTDYTLLDEALLDNLTFSKVYADGTNFNLFGIALDAASGDAYEFFETSADEGGYSVTLDLAIVDGETSGDTISAMTTSEDHFFLIYDGLRDGSFHDPIVITETGTEGTPGGSGNCNVGFSPASALLLLPLLGLVKKR